MVDSAPPPDIFNLSDLEEFSKSPKVSTFAPPGKWVLGSSITLPGVLFLLSFSWYRLRFPAHSLHLRDLDNSDPRDFSQRNSSRSPDVLSLLDAHLA
jgi:hypothetical protein